MTKYANTGLLFNKHYYRKIIYWNPTIRNFDYKKDDDNISRLKENNEILFRSSLDNTPEPIGNKNFELTTTYPGLFLGSGYPHEAGVEGELKLGFFFDYATGIPILPGSSVKGVLRNAFEVANGDYVKALLEKKLKIATSKIEDLYNKKVKIEGIKGKVPYIIASIFHGYYPVKKDDKITYKQIGVYKRDIFFDAVPYGKVPERKFLANDFITPHENPLKNPVPLQFLKVLPGVSFRFDFKLHDLTDENGTVLLTADEKKELFRLILLDLGIGAKTNVGYGQFSEKQSKDDNLESDESNNSIPEIELIKREDVKPGEIIQCEIDRKVYRENEDKFQLYLRPYIENYEQFLKELDKTFPSIKLAHYEVKKIYPGDIIKCKVQRIGNDGRVFFEFKIIK